ncbi:MAG: GAF domain-containing sensor histidine kinase [Chloroflexi bacterium]|nr:GAF domain-containing sensor histidine kinase [Chloroflexota bacterium]
MTSHTTRVGVFTALYDIAVATSGVLEPVELARLVVEQARELLEADAAGVYSIDESGQLLTPMYSSDAHDDGREPAIPIGLGAAGQAFLSGQVVRVDDYPNWPHAGPWAAANGVQSAMSVPLQLADRRTGALSVRRYTPRQWTDQDAQTLTLLAAQIGPALEAARLHERTRDAGQQAEAASKLRDEILAGVSHDLAGPLARIRLYAELIQTELSSVQPVGPAEQIGLWSERIVVATETMKTTIHELIDVARLQIGHVLQLDLRRTDLVGLARRLIGEHQAAGHRISLQSSCAELIGWWDEPRLSRVLANLLDNAVKYSPPGEQVEVEVDVDVDVDHQQGAEHALLRVRDHGRGIPPADQPRVFERFYRGSNVDAQTAGSGLGLAVAQQIVKQHGGAIDIDSQPGFGTVVSIRVPRTASSEPT